MPQQDEQAFRQWYTGHAQRLGINPDPDDPQHFYDYRAAFRSGATPDASGHWPSAFKREGHPRMIIDGVNTKTGQPAADSAWKVVDESAWKTIEEEPQPPKRTYEYPTTAGFLKNAAQGAVRQVQGMANLAQKAQIDPLGASQDVVHGFGQIPARVREWMNDPLQTIQDDPTAAALDVSSVVGGVAAAPRFLRGVSGLRAPIGRGIVATGQAAQDLAASIPGKSAGVAGAIYEGMHGRPINAVGALAVPKAIEYGGELTKMLGRKIQGPSPKPPQSLIERYAPNVSGYETPSPASVGRGFDPANPPVFDPRIGGIMEGEAAPVGSHVTHPEPSVQPNLTRSATTPQVIPESWGKLTDVFTGSNAQLNGRLIKARAYMKADPNLTLEQAMKKVAAEQ